MSAIIFDLDDTLFRERRWVVSGFAAVARHLEVSVGVDRRHVLQELVAALRAGQRREALQKMCRRFDLPVDLIPGLVALIRSHRPRLRLGRGVSHTLTQLRESWQLGVLTNGLPAVQERKIAALGIRPMVDAVVYASQYGGGKPQPAPFLEVADRVGAEPTRCVFVGNDLRCDIHGARKVGMHTIRMRQPGPQSLPAGFPEADAVVERLADVAAVADRLMTSESNDANVDMRACG